MARVPPQALFLFGAVIVVLSLESGGVVVEVNGYTIEPGADLTGADLERADQNPCQNGLVLQGHFGGFVGPRARWCEFSNIGSPHHQYPKKIHAISPRVPEAIYRG